MESGPGVRAGGAHCPMRLTRHTDYAFRALIYLGLLEKEQLATIGNIATDYGISRNHLMKVIQKLVQSGYVHSVRGKFGGVCLRLPPGDVRLGAVARVTESHEPMLDCRDDSCPLSSECPLQDAMDEAMDAFFLALDRYTLEDMLAQPERLAALVGMDGRGLPVRVRRHVAGH